MKRAISILVIGLLLAAASVALAQDGHGSEDAYAPERGAAVFAEFCQACHGPRGESIAPAFVAIEYNPETAHDALVNGLDSDPDDGVAMPPYGKLLSEQQVAEVLAYMATWETGDTPPLPEPHIEVAEMWRETALGDPQTGAVLYAKTCLGCHGMDGKGRGVDDFPPFKVTDQTAQQVSAGVENVYMPAFGEANGGPLDQAALDDLSAYLATWDSASTEDNSPAGMNVLVIVMGLVAILTVGGAYMSQVIRTET